MDLYGPDFPDSKDLIFSDSRDPIFNSVDTNRVPKTPKIINVLNATESGAFSKQSLFHRVKRFQQAKCFPGVLHLLSCVGIFRR